MAHNQDIGKAGEDIACQYLLQKQYKIIARNWRCGHLEVDIIAYHNEVLHIVEVKTRTNIQYGYPEEQITTKKFRLLQDAAVQYLELHPQYHKIQFDIIAINLLPNAEPHIAYFEDYYM